MATHPENVEVAGDNIQARAWCPTCERVGASDIQFDRIRDRGPLDLTLARVAVQRLAAMPCE